MCINYTSVIGVGVPEEDITYKSLSEKGKEIIQASYIDSLCQEDFYDDEDDRISDSDLLADVDLNEWFLNNIGGYDLWYELRLEQNTGNYFTGEKGYRGVSVDLNNIQEAKDQFKKVVSLDPEVFNGVLVW